MKLKPTYTYDAVITRVVDGDTVDATVDLGFKIFRKIRIRLAGIDAPEGKRTPAAEHLRFVATACKGICVVRTQKPDKYGRCLATVEVNGIDMSKRLIARGMAVPYHGGKRKKR